MTNAWAVPLTTLAPVRKELSPIAFGGSLYGEGQWQDDKKATLLVAMRAALELGINHFDTAAGYGGGASEPLLGEFLEGRREQVFLASKASIDDMKAELMLEQVDKSLERLKTDFIDLFYIHWPRTGKDMRPLMEGLMLAKQQGKIKAIGVSNFSVEQMEQVAEVGRIDAHQLGYNLLWRFAEKDVIPYCREKGIAVMAYSPIAQGILTGKFSRELNLIVNDQRNSIVLFNEAVWPHVYEAVEQLKVLAHEVQRPLVHLAIRWILQREGLHTAIVGAKNERQIRSNAAALEGDIPAYVFDRMTSISDEIIPFIPNSGNMFNYYP